VLSAPFALLTREFFARRDEFLVLRLLFALFLISNFKFEIVFGCGSPRWRENNLPGSKCVAPMSFRRLQ
jgi:hypothetical protein